MEQDVTAYKRNHWLDLRQAFRLVPGLAVSHQQCHANNHSLKAVPHGYSLSPSGLGTVKKSRKAGGCSGCFRLRQLSSQRTDARCVFGAAICIRGAVERIESLRSPGSCARGIGFRQSRIRDRHAVETICADSRIDILGYGALEAHQRGLEAAHPAAGLCCFYL